MRIGTQSCSRRGWCRRLGMGALGIAGISRVSALGADKPDHSDTEADERLKELKEAAASYAIERESDPPVRLALVPEPALRWSNPLRRAYDGAVFVWVADSRPQVIASFYRNMENGRTMEHHEFLSLSGSSINATDHAGHLWAPRAPGLDWQSIPGAPAPASSAAGRRRQLHGLARGFSSGYQAEERSTGLSLRMLIKPLYEYDDGVPEQFPGAVFAFVQATDPEVILIIEARKGAEGPAWNYSLARMTSRGLRAWHDNRLVWEASPVTPGPSDAAYGKIKFLITHR